MKEEYFELSVTSVKYLDLFSDFLFELGITAIEEKKDSIVIRDENDLKEVQWGIERFAEELSKSKKEDIKITQKLNKKKSVDWIEEYKNSITPVQIGRFYIHPTWEKNKKNFINILIDPALSFGTGHHESTSSCLELFGKLIKGRDLVLDVGCGSGILSIAANKLGAYVDLCDSDPLCIKSSKRNFKLNKAGYRHIWEGSANGAKNRYDMVVANIVADVLMMINKDLKKTVKKNGNLILSGILDRYLDNVLLKFSDFELIETIKKGEWITLHLKKE